MGVVLPCVPGRVTNFLFLFIKRFRDVRADKRLPTSLRRQKPRRPPLESRRSRKAESRYRSSSNSLFCLATSALHNEQHNWPVPSGAAGVLGPPPPAVISLSAGLRAAHNTAAEPSGHRASLAHAAPNCL